jgi:hypothetical protein
MSIKLPRFTGQPIFFFTFHRYYTWRYESALRHECGYNGTQPYWDWSSTNTIAEQPLFDGSATSIPGNGVATNHTSTVYLPTPNVTNSTIPSGSGGKILNCWNHGTAIVQRQAQGYAVAVRPGDVT